MKPPFVLTAIIAVAVILGACGQKRREARAEQERYYKMIADYKAEIGYVRDTILHGEPPHSDNPPSAEEEATVETEEHEIEIDTTLFRQEKVMWKDSNYDIRVEYVVSKNNSALKRSINNELKKNLCDLLFVEDQGYSIEELVIRGVYGFQRDSIVCDYGSITIHVSPIALFHNKEITSIAYVCANNLGGSMNGYYTLCHVFRNSNGRRLYFDDIVKPASRREFFRIAHSEWWLNPQRWYNPFSKDGYCRDKFDYDDELYKKDLSRILKRNFYFTNEGLVLSYNLYDWVDYYDGKSSDWEWDAQHGKTDLLLSYDKIGRLIEMKIAPAE